MKLWAVRNISTGRYFSAGTNSSSAPSVYLTKGKAEGRRKQLGASWSVVFWHITEEIVE